MVTNSYSVTAHAYSDGTWSVAVVERTYERGQLQNCSQVRVVHVDLAGLRPALEASMKTMLRGAAEERDRHS